MVKKFIESTSWSWIIGIVIVFSDVGISWFFWFRFTSKHYPCMWKCTLTPKRSPVTNTTQQLNTNTAELQITRGEEGERMDVERGTSNKEASGSQILPTVFVRPGQAIAYHP
jgi:hypothetical protein